MNEPNGCLLRRCYSLPRLFGGLDELDERGCITVVAVEEGCIAVVAAALGKYRVLGSEGGLLYYSVLGTLLSRLVGGLAVLFDAGRLPVLRRVCGGGWGGS